jgi:hypothetical protein
MDYETRDSTGGLLGPLVVLGGARRTDAALTPRISSIIAKISDSRLFELEDCNVMETELTGTYNR